MKLVVLLDGALGQDCLDVLEVSTGIEIVGAVVPPEAYTNGALWFFEQRLKARLLLRHPSCEIWDNTERNHETNQT